MDDEDDVVVEEVSFIEVLIEKFVKFSIIVCFYFLRLICLFFSFY